MWENVWSGGFQACWVDALAILVDALPISALSGLGGPSWPGNGIKSRAPPERTMGRLLRERNRLVVMDEVETARGTTASGGDAIARDKSGKPSWLI